MDEVSRQEVRVARFRQSIESVRTTNTLENLDREF